MDRPTNANPSTIRRRITRVRPSLSCLGCRTRKVKCDRQRPACKNCCRAEEPCVYDHLETVLEPRKRKKGAPKITQNIKPSETDAINAPFWETTRDLASFAHGNNSPQNSTRDGYLSQHSGGRDRYVSGSFWGLLGNHREELDELLKNKSTARTIGPNSAGLLTIVTKKFPPKSICDSLMKAFLLGVAPIFSFVDASSLIDAYEQFWEWHLSGSGQRDPTKLTDDPSWIPLTLAALLCGAISMSPGAWGKDMPRDCARSRLKEQLYSTTMEAFQLCDYPRLPTVMTVTASVLVHSCLGDEEDSVAGAQFVAKSFRAAQIIGCHRNSTTASINGERGKEQHIWQEIEYLDIQTSILSGLPPLSYAKDNSLCSSSYPQLEVKMVSSALHAPLPEATRASLSQGSITKCLAISRHLCTLLARQILDKLYCQRSPSPDDTVTLQKAIRQVITDTEYLISMMPADDNLGVGLIKSLEASADLATDKDSYLDNSVTVAIFGSWCSITLKLVLKSVVLLYDQYFLHDLGQQVGQATWNSAVESSHTILKHFIQLVRVPAFQPYRWFVFSSLQPIIPAMVLLNHVEMHRNALEVTESYSLIKETCQIMTAEFEHSTSCRLRRGRKEWEMLKTLHQKIFDPAGYKKANEDRKKIMEELLESFRQDQEFRYTSPLTMDEG